MGNPLDLAKFRKNITKAIPGISSGFKDPDTWISTGSYALNYLISSDFNKGVPLGKVTCFAGESGCLQESAIINIMYSKKGDTEENEARITVGGLKNLLNSKSYDLKIDTPDGWCTVSEFINKGELPMVKVSTSEFSTTCSEQHLIEVESELIVGLEGAIWLTAKELKVGNKIMTKNGIQDVISVEAAEPAVCYDFTVDHPNHRYYGDGISSHNSGKSYICSGNIIRDAQRQGILVILIDSENALDEEWLRALGVDTSEDKLIKFNMALIDDVAKTISEFMKDYTANNYDQKVLFVVDSLGMLLTPTDVKQFEDGDLKGDMGRKPKQLGALVRNCVNMFGTHNVGLVATNHTYQSQNIFDPDDKVSGGQMFIYASSIVIGMGKLKLKEDDEGNKTTDVKGIRSVCKVMKSRYSKPFETVSVKIPYEEGMNPYSGLVDMFEAKGILVKDGNSLRCDFLTGNSIKKFRKAWERNEDQCLDALMKEVMERDRLKPKQFEYEEGDEEFDISDIVGMVEGE